MTWIHVVVLAVVQGLAELLPVSSSAHVIITAKLLHEDMSTPANALLLVMLHTGTMFAVVVYFWSRWSARFFSSWDRFVRFAKLVFVASLLSGVVGYPIIVVLEHVLGRGGHTVDVEVLFRRLQWIAPALLVVGVLIAIAGIREARQPAGATRALSWPRAVVMGILQGIAIPFRGFSRSGATISGGLLAGGERDAIESFSFAMVVAITPLAIARELWRALRATRHTGVPIHLGTMLAPGLVGMTCAFLAGLFALRWLSRWLEHGRWHWFGAYCMAAAVVVQILALRGW